MNRAIAKRPYFESRGDKRFFLSRLVREVRAGTLELHAYCLMTTHFHLLVRSPTGNLSLAMKRAQNAYSRYFNRRRGRDGPLIRSRFHSKRVETLAYRIAVVRYIDANPVRAGLGRAPAEHEFGSARAHGVGPRPRWLCGDWIESHARSVAGAEEFVPAHYAVAFRIGGEQHVREVAEFVEARLASSAERDPVDDLIGSTPQQVRRWLESKARLADGMEIGLPVCGPAALGRAVAVELRERGEWLIDRKRAVLRGSELARVGLLRDLCSESLARIGRMTKLGTWKVTDRVAFHRALLETDPVHAERVARIANTALRPPASGRGQGGSEPEGTGPAPTAA